MFPFLPFLSLPKCNCGRPKLETDNIEAGYSQECCASSSHTIPSVLRFEYTKKHCSNTLASQNPDIKNNNSKTLPVLEATEELPSDGANINPRSVDSMNNGNDSIVSDKVVEDFDETLAFGTGQKKLVNTNSFEPSQDYWTTVENEGTEQTCEDSTTSEIGINSIPQNYLENNTTEVHLTKTQEILPTQNSESCATQESEINISNSQLTIDTADIETRVAESSTRDAHQSQQAQPLSPLSKTEVGDAVTVIKLPSSSSCSSLASSSALPSGRQSAVSSRSVTPSPTGSKSPRTVAPMANTPPGIRAARARQRAFQTSQAMMDLFGGADAPEKIADDKKPTSNPNVFNSEPGPEIIEPNAPTSEVVVLTPDEEQDGKKSARSKSRSLRGNLNGKNGAVDSDKAEDLSLLAKMQLSNPGPEVASENEELEENEEENLISNKKGNVNNEKGKDEEVANARKTAMNVFSEAENNLCAQSKDTEETGPTISSTITGESNGQTKLDNESEDSDVIVTSESDEVEVIVEYDAFGRRFERRKPLKREEIKKKKKIHRERKNNLMKEELRTTLTHGGYVRAGSSGGHDMSGVITNSSHLHASSNSTFQRRKENSEEKKTKDGCTVATTRPTKSPREMEKNANSNAFLRREGRQQEEHVTLADGITKDYSEEAGAGKKKCKNNSGGYSNKGHNDNSPLRNLSDQNFNRNSTESNSKSVSIRGDGKSQRIDAIYSNTHREQSTPRQGQFNTSLNGSSSTTSPRITGGSGGGGGGGMTNGTDSSTAAAGGGSGGDTLENTILIRQANVINDDEIFCADILIEDGLITKISDSLTVPEAVDVIEASGRWILPAGIDVHTQFSKEHSATNNSFSNGTKAALAGGTATVIDVVCPKQGESLAAAVDRVRRAVEQHANCHFGITVIVGGTWNDQIRGQMTEVVCEKGVNGFLLDFHSDANIFEAFEHAKQLGAHCSIVPENSQIVNLLEKHHKSSQYSLAKLEAERIQRYCVFSQLTNAPFSILCIHTSSEVNHTIRNGRSDGAHLTAQIPLKNLADGSTPFGSGDTKTQTDYALELLADSTLCMCASNDSSNLIVPSKPPPPYMNGSQRSDNSCAAVENRLSLLWERGVITAARLDPMRFVAVTSSNPAKIFNIYPKKGKVAVGSDADLVMWDFESARTLGNGGGVVHATPLLTICGGQIAFRNGNICKPNSKKMTGSENKVQISNFVSLPTRSPYLFSAVELREKTFSLAQLSIAAHKNPKIPASLGVDSSRRTSIASSCASAATTSDAFAVHERKPSNASVGNNVTNRPVTAGSRNRNVQSTNPPKRSTTKVIQPPGGKSTGFW